MEQLGYKSKISRFQLTFVAEQIDKSLTVVYARGIGFFGFSFKLKIFTY